MAAKEHTSSGVTWQSNIRPRFTIDFRLGIWAVGPLDPCLMVRSTCFSFESQSCSSNPRFAAQILIFYHLTLSKPSNFGGQDLEDQKFHLASGKWGDLPSNPCSKNVGFATQSRGIRCTAYDLPKNLRWNQRNHLQKKGEQPVPLKIHIDLPHFAPWAHPQPHLSSGHLRQKIHRRTPLAALLTGCDGSSETDDLWSCGSPW